MSFKPSAAPAGTDVAAEDWDLLFNAIRMRLHQTITTLPTLQGGDALRSAQASMLECMQALEQLHLAALHELDRRQTALNEATRTMTTIERPSEAKAGRPRHRSPPRA
jgi:hypothetical protein